MLVPPFRPTCVFGYKSFPSWIYNWLLLIVQWTIYLSNIQNKNRSPPTIDRVFPIYSSVGTHSPNTIRTMVSRLSLHNITWQPLIERASPFTIWGRTVQLFGLGSENRHQYLCFMIYILADITDKDVKSLINHLEI